MGISIEQVAGPVALAAAGTFAGASLFVSAVEHPAAMKDSVSNFYNYFPHMYHRAKTLQGSLAMVGSHAAALAAAKSDDKQTRLLWSVSGLMLGAVWPYTLLAMMPTNKKIIQQDSADDAEKASLLTHWGKLHMVRTALSATSFAVMIAALVRSSRSSS